MNSGGLPCSSPVAPAAAVIGPPPGPGVPTAAAVAAPGVLKLKFCRYYAKDKTCFYGEECQFLHEEPGGASAACPGPPPPVALGGLPLGLPPGSAAPSVAVAASPGHGGSGGYPAHGVAAPGAGPKKPPELLGGGGGAGGGGGGGLDGPRLASECGSRESRRWASGAAGRETALGWASGLKAWAPRLPSRGSGDVRSVSRRWREAPEEGGVGVV